MCVVVYTCLISYYTNILPLIKGKYDFVCDIPGPDSSASNIGRGLCACK